MKLLVISDSHNDIRNMKRVLDNLSDKIDLVLFLGDCSEDLIKIKGNYKNLEIRYVIGNCDMYDVEPEELLFKVANKSVFMAHGHRHQVKRDTSKIIYRAMEAGADICLFGHTHCPTCFKEENILIMNPGSIAFPRSYKYPTYGIINIEEGEIEGRIVAIEGDKTVIAEGIKRY